MKRILVFVLIGVLIFSASIMATKSPTELFLQEGKNNITLTTDFDPFYVEDFVRAYPEIDTVTLVNENNQSLNKGYVNIFGGIGENFVFRPNQTYEISIKQNFTVKLR